jgi:hypothetical protein
MDHLSRLAPPSSLHFGMFLTLRPLSAVSMSFSDLTFPHLSMFGMLQVLYTYILSQDSSVIGVDWAGVVLLKKKRRSGIIIWLWLLCFCSLLLYSRLIS